MNSYDLSQQHLTGTRNLDVHLTPASGGGAAMKCIDCHKVENHRFPGRGTDLRAVESPTQMRCESCHGNSPHDEKDLNAHVARVSCTVCHIPYFAKAAATDMFRDYSAPADITTTGLYEPHMDRRADMAPVYAFFNGTSKFYQFSSPAVKNSNGKVMMSSPIGEISDPAVKLMAFKHHNAVQPWDPVTHKLIPLNMKTYFETGDIDRAAQKGVADAGWDWNGYQFVQTERYMALFHEVAPADQALNCSQCHSSGNRLDFSALGYDPKTTRNGKPLCISCHEDESDEWPGESFFTEVHRKHVDEERVNCNQCHGFSQAQNQNSDLSLRVTMNPEAASTGARWRIDAGSWYPSGQILSSVPAGAHRITFSTIDGFVIPQSQDITLPNFRITDVTGAYGLYAPPAGNQTSLPPILQLLLLNTN